MLDRVMMKIANTEPISILTACLANVTRPDNITLEERRTIINQGVITEKLSEPVQRAILTRSLSGCSGCHVDKHLSLLYETLCWLRHFM